MRFAKDTGAGLDPRGCSGLFLPTRGLCSGGRRSLLGDDTAAPEAAGDDDADDSECSSVGATGDAADSCEYGCCWCCCCWCTPAGVDGADSGVDDGLGGGARDGGATGGSGVVTSWDSNADSSSSHALVLFRNVCWPDSSRATAGDRVISVTGAGEALPPPPPPLTPSARGVPRLSPPNGDFRDAGVAVAPAPVPLPLPLPPRMPAPLGGMSYGDDA